jgi:microcystin-dependent protein
MAFSLVQYTGDGSTTNFAVPFPYLNQSDVHVAVNGVLQTTVTWLNAGLVQVQPAPAAGTTVLLSRQTSYAAEAVTFVDGSTVQAADLNAQAKQDLFLAQEASDRAEQNITFDTATGQLNAAGLRIENLGDAVEDGDAVNKRTAAAYTNAAATSAQAAGAFATDSNNAANEALAASVSAQTSATDAATSATSAAESAEQAASTVAAGVAPPTTSRLGSVFAIVGAAKKWLSSLGTDGNFVLTQPSLEDLSDVTADGLNNAQAPYPTMCPPGMIADFAMPTPPPGWLVCNGAAISRSTYANLFAAIGGYWGAGNGSTTFNVPDLRGAFRRGWDNGRGLNPDGTGFAAFQDYMYVSHTHGVYDPTHAHGVYDPGHAHGGVVKSYAPGGQLAAATPGWQLISGGTDAAGTGIAIYGAYTGISIAAAGGNEVRPRNYSVLTCIKY